MSGPSESDGAPQAASASAEGLDDLLEREIALMRQAAEALADAADAARTFDDPNALADLQDRNLAAFEAMNAAAGQRAADMLRVGVDRAFASLEKPADDVESADPLRAMAEMLETHRRAALLESVNGVSPEREGEREQVGAEPNAEDGEA